MNKYKLSEMDEKNLLNEEEGDDYSWDAIKLYKHNRRYVFFFDGGCSCNGPWEGSLDNYLGDDYSKPEILKLMNAWNGKGYNSGPEQRMKTWVLENIK